MLNVYGHGRLGPLIPWSKGGSLNRHILWTIIIGFVAGVIAKFITPGDRDPKGFILTTILGVVGAFVATYLGQAIGWYGPDQNAGFQTRDQRLGDRRPGDERGFFDSWVTRDERENSTASAWRVD